MKHSMAVETNCDKIIGCITFATIQFGDGNGQMALQGIIKSRLINL
ncbi:MAG: hypothetical protein KH611_10775 [Clostridium sp.]|nr:hypothetical protein [Clostridium sp.]